MTIDVEIRTTGDIQAIRQVATTLNMLAGSGGTFWWAPKPDNWYIFRFTDPGVAEAFVQHQMRVEDRPVDDIKYGPA